MNFDLQFYRGLIFRRLPVMTALFLLCAVTATVLALKLPPTYTTSARLLVEEPQIPDSMIETVVETDAGQQLEVIEQRLLTRANMLDIARKFNVFEDIRDMSPDEIVEGMRQQTNVRRTGGRGQATLMSVSFEGRSPRIAANVVNEYVTLILQESSDFRMGRAESALSFFEQEVQRLNADLSTQSAEIVKFKNANATALPDDLPYRQGRVSLLQERQSRLENDVAVLEKQRDDMVTIFEATGQIGPQGAPKSQEEAQLQALRSELNSALAIYSETNPRITLLQNRIAQMEKTVQEQMSAPGIAGTANGEPASLMDVTLAEMNQRIDAMKQEYGNVSRELQELIASIQATAGNAIALNALERDYENVQARYNDAVRNLKQARVNERIVVSAQGQRVTVIEGANVPQEPSGPNRIKFIAAGIAAGGGLAVGFFMLLELLNRSIRRPFELQSKFGIVPLAVIPYMESTRERFMRRAVLLGAFVAVLILVPTALWYIDTRYMPLDILANKVFDRLGIS